MLNSTARHQHSSAAASPVDPRMRGALAAPPSFDSSPTELMRERAPQTDGQSGFDTRKRRRSGIKGKGEGYPSFPIWLFVVLFAGGIQDYSVIQCVRVAEVTLVF